jgi:HD superfamily phosphohydrolase
MMLDAILRDFGLQMNEDPSCLDNPLDQVGDGIAPDCFGVYSGKEPLAKDDVLTNRDIIFIKECILGKPLKPRSTFIGRKSEHRKEFLYDIVSNRHNGLDVDKIDYFARDKHFAQGDSIIKRLSVLIHEAFVAKVHCPYKEKCCLGKSNIHLMICYPKKLATNVMDFFHTRFIMHQEVYTHKAHKGAEMLIRDILLKADPYFEIVEGYNISRAISSPDAFRYLKDSVIDLIEFSRNTMLEDAHALIRRLRNRDLYKQICLKPLNDEQESILGHLSEESMKARMLEVASDYKAAVSFDLEHFVREELILELRTIHHGMKEKNPTEYCRFLSKPKPLLVEHIDDLPVAEQLDESEYLSHLPRKFQEISLMAFSRCSKKDTQRAAKHEFCRHLIEQWLELMRHHSPITNLALGAAPMPCSQNSDDESYTCGDRSFLDDY